MAIAEATLAQAEGTAEQVRQQREAGRIAEFDLLRAQVARDSQRPEVIRRRNARDLAYLRLKQLLELPLDAPTAAGVQPRGAGAAAAVGAVRRGDRRRRSRRDAVRARAPRSPRPATTCSSAKPGSAIARAQRLPSVSVSSAYGHVAYPAGVPVFGDFRTNWTIGATAQVPIFTGGRLKADEMTARADLVGDAGAAAADAASSPRWTRRRPGSSSPTRARPGSRPPASCSRRSAPTRSPSCATAKACRPSSSCPMRGCCCSRRRPAAAQAARDVQTGARQAGAAARSAVVERAARRPRRRARRRRNRAAAATPAVGPDPPAAAATRPGGN